MAVERDGGTAEGSGMKLKILHSEYDGKKYTVLSDGKIACVLLGDGDEFIDENHLRQHIDNALKTMEHARQAERRKAVG